MESERVDVAVSFCFSLRLRLGLVLADFLSRYFSVNPETLFLGKTTNQTLERESGVAGKEKKKKSGLSRVGLYLATLPF